MEDFVRDELMAMKARQEVASFTPPDYMEWVIGWKHLKIDDEGVAISSIGDNYPWQKGENRASHFGVFHGCPCEGNHCGFNAFYEKDLCKMAYGRANVVVRGRGERFANHPDGFRAEYAEILCFIGRGEHYQKAAKRYAVPLFKWHWQVDQYLRRHRVLGDYFPKDRRTEKEPIKEPIIRKIREVDWNEVPIGDMQSVLTNGYTIFALVLWLAAIAGFILGALNVGGML